MKIAFTSCSKIQNQKVQSAWKSIEDEEPNHLLMLGDNVYSPNLTGSIKKMEKRYKQQFREENFRNLIRKVPYNAIWDDHDFAWNNAKGAHMSVKRKDKARDLFHRYMNCSNNLPHVYHAFDLEQIKVIMLDGRYYREKPRWRKNATILGSEQEQWLIKQLDHNLKYTIVCSGSTLTSKAERWDKYKNYYPKFCEMLKNKGNCLYLGGDIHRNDFVEHDGFFEIISSGVGRNSLNNYGILEYTDNKLIIKLKGNSKENVINEEIDLSSWKLL